MALTTTGLVVWFAVDANRQGTSPPAEATSAVARGETLYRRHCSTCHGKNGKGEGAAAQFLSKPPLNFHSDTAANYSGDQLFEKITEGNPSTGMPAWEKTLSQSDREAIVLFLRKEFIGER